MTRNSSNRWSSGSKVLHWLLVVMIATEVPAGYLMANTYGPALRHPDMLPLHHLLSQIHHTNGFLILALAAFRLGWRTRHPAPGLPEGLQAYQRVLARATQGFLYALLLAIPLTGWIALTVLADSEQFGKTSIWFFGTDSMPRLPFITPKPFDAPGGYGLFGPLHIYLVYAGGVLLALHVMGALWHHLVRRDQVLLNMWPGTAPRG